LQQNSSVLDIFWLTRDLRLYLTVVLEPPKAAKNGKFFAENGLWETLPFRINHAGIKHCGTPTRVYGMVMDAGGVEMRRLRGRKPCCNVRKLERHSLWSGACRARGCGFYVLTTPGHKS
jgi:hypothetical protein